MFGRGKKKAEEERQRRENEYARVRDVEELERRVARVEARVRVLRAASQIAELRGAS